MGEEPPSPSVIEPDLELVREMLDALDVSYLIDDHGRLVTHWKGYSLYLRFHGEEREIFSVRLLVDRLFAVEDKPALRAIADEWNRDTTVLKAYTATDDDGSVLLAAESHLRVAGGVIRDQFTANTTAWLHAAGSFCLWLAHRLPLAGLADDPMNDDPMNDDN